MKNDPQITAQDFRFWIDQEVRFRDLDTLKHVNHTVYFIYAEMARLEYYRQILGMDLMNELAFLMLDIRAATRWRRNSESACEWDSGWIG